MHPARMEPSASFDVPASAGQCQEGDVRTHMDESKPCEKKGKKGERSLGVERKGPWGWSLDM